MKTEQLIAALSADIARVPRHALASHIGRGIVGGGLVALLVSLVILGARPDLPLAVQGFSFWMKFTYAVWIGVGALYAVGRLARPVPGSLRGLWLLAIPVLLLAGIGIDELATTPMSEWLSMWLGHSWKVCSWLVFALAVPVFFGLLGALRKLAPTRLRPAGAAAGLAAGAWAAAIYCLHCPEVSAIFVLTWYSLGMLLAAAAGALFAPWLMRW